MAESDDTTGEMSEGLQVELFHPESDREPGDTNIQALGFDIHPVVFPVALVLIALFIAVTILLGDQASAAYTFLFNFIGENFGWFYLLAVNIFIVVLLFFAFSKYGKIKIGGVEAEKEFSDFSWMAMLFSAGMGIGLMFFSVSEPLYYFQNVPGFFGAEAGTGAAAQAAMAQTFFHWGFHPWAIYGLVGLGLAFFSFNRGLPLTFRSIFWPLLGERIHGWPGHVIDILSVMATLFGLSTSLRIGVQQINAGLAVLSSQFLSVTVPQATWAQVVLIGLITAIATLSVAAGLDGGVRRLSEVNLYLMTLLLSLMVVVGPTLYLLGTFVSSIGTYVDVLPELVFWTETGGGTEWQRGWTIFYWGWWISWSPFVGMFIARISKGRTVREFVLGVFLLPSLFSFFWMSVFGGSALFVELETARTLVDAVDADVATAMFAAFPLTVPTSVLGVVLVVTFFVTSSDSGSLVVDAFTSGGKLRSPVTQRVFWASMEGLVAAILLVGGGLKALQTAAITTGLPFAVILIIMGVSLRKGLKKEYEKEELRRKARERESYKELVQDLIERDEKDGTYKDREDTSKDSGKNDREQES